LEKSASLLGFHHNASAGSRVTELVSHRYFPFA
jgi:hypothetical protein